MFKKYLDWLDSKGRKRTVLDRQSKDPYLERYYIFLKDRVKFPFNIFLHKFLKSDPDDLHDHPWPYATLILKGGYWEWTPIHEYIHGYTNDYGKYCTLDVPIKTGKITGEQRIWRGPGHFRISSATSLHRIELDPNVKECWTLFMPGRRQREWGFITHKNWKDFRWLHNEDYIEGKKE